MNASIPRTLVMVPGHNEPPEHFDRLRRGTSHIPGLDAYGIDSITFGPCNDTLCERIDRYADFVTDLRKAGHEFPIAQLGYSLGGLVIRGFLRRYPHRAHEISHTVMIATPNWGVRTFALPQIHALLRTPDKAFAELDLYSDFMRWLNGTGGRWELTSRGWHDWTLNDEPWIGPPGAKLISIAGLMPSRGGDNDGLVWGDSATLGSRIPAHFIVGPNCNHMNVIGHWEPLVMFSMGFKGNNRVWPLTLRAVTRFLGAQLRPRVEHPQAV